MVVLLMVIKSIINKFKSNTEKSDDSAEYVAKIKDAKPVDNIVDDFFNAIDGAAE